MVDSPRLLKSKPTINGLLTVLFDEKCGLNCVLSPKGPMADDVSSWLMMLDHG